MQKNILKSIIYFLLPTKNQGLKGRVRKIKKRNFPLLGLDLRVRKGPPPRLDMEKFWNTNFSINKSGKCSKLGGVSEGHFPHPIFLFFWLQMVLKSFLDIEVLFMYWGGLPWGSSSPPRLHRYILR